MQGSSDVKRLVVSDKNYHERCLCCQVISPSSHSWVSSISFIYIFIRIRCSFKNKKLKNKGKKKDTQRVKELNVSNA